MTREEAIDTLKNGLWWDRKQLDEAIDIAVPALRPVSREQVEKVWRGKSMENEKLFLALRAGARAIVNNKRLHGTLYCWDIWGENGGPKERTKLEAATLLAETADKMEERPPEGEDNEKTNT